MILVLYILVHHYIVLYLTMLMHWFAELGVEYCPPSQYLLPVLETDCGKQNTDCLDSMEEAWKVENLLSSDSGVFCIWTLSTTSSTGSFI